MNRTLARIAGACALAASLVGLPAHADQSIDIKGWGTGKVQPIPLDPGRPWGWAVRDFLEEPNRPLYNRAKEKLLRGEQIFSHVISEFDIKRYCEEAPHYDFTWFEMQHSLMRYDEVAKMVAACPRAGATPILRLPDALEGSVQKANGHGNARHHRAHDQRCDSSARSGTICALSPDRAS